MTDGFGPIDPPPRGLIRLHGHGLVTGPPGSGRSPVLRALLDERLIDQGAERVQVYVVASGRDWRPWADWAARHAAAGRRVTTLDHTACRLAPFQAARFLCQPDDDYTIWDPLGDLVMTVRLMLASQHPDEAWSRHHRRHLHQALYAAAHRAEAANRLCRTQDVRDALHAGHQVPDALLQTLEAFCQGALGEIFNAEAPTLLWEADSDIVLIDPAGCYSDETRTPRDALEGLLTHGVMAHTLGLGEYEFDHHGSSRERLVILDGFPGKPIQHGRSIFMRALARSRGARVSTWLGLPNRAALDAPTWSRFSASLGSYIGLPHGNSAWLKHELEQADRLGPYLEKSARSALHGSLELTTAREPGEPCTGAWIDLANGAPPALFYLPDVEET